MRVPARFSVVVGAALALLGGVRRARACCGSAARRRRAAASARRSPWSCSSTCASTRGCRRTAPTIPSIYSRVTPDMVLVELPRRARQIDYMYFSTRHWARLLGGYSGFIRCTRGLMDGWKAFPSPDVDRLLPARRRDAPHLQLRARRETESLRRGVRVLWTAIPAWSSSPANAGSGPTSASIA